MYTAAGWKDFEVLDAGDGQKLERWGSCLLSRPDPQVIWPKAQPELWEAADAVYRRDAGGGGSWQVKGRLPEAWELGYADLRFKVRPTGFKHTGLFPEQAANWDWMRGLLRRRPQARVLNLFAYTGGATVACAAEGARVTHVDAARGMTRWARENLFLNGLGDGSARFIVEDASSFVRRELRRGNRYDGILMDPPSYGRGPSGEVWRLEDTLFDLARDCAALLSEEPLFFLISSYTTGLQATVLHNILRQTAGAARGGGCQAGELVLPIRTGGLLPCGCTGRWQA